MGEYEPRDSRRVTGAGAPPQAQPGQNPTGQSPTGQGQMDQGQMGQDQAGGGQPQQFEADPHRAGESNQRARPAGGMEAHTRAGGGESDRVGGTMSHAMGGGTHPLAGQIREHMTVIGADGVPLGTVDRIEGQRLKLTRAASGHAGGAHDGHHHTLPLGLVAAVEDTVVRLSANADVAYAMEDEDGDGDTAG